MAAAARTAKEIREAFLRFFETKAHRRLPSASVVPEGDVPEILRNRRILADQMRFLTAQCPQRRDRPADDTDLP